MSLHSTVVRVMSSGTRTSPQSSKDVISIANRVGKLWGYLDLVDGCSTR